MRQLARMLVFGAICGMLAGCGQSTPSGTSESSSTGSSSSPSATAQESSKPKYEGPAGAVYDFLEAVRKGDDTTAERMLTSQARKKTQEMNMVVSPPGSDTARFEIGKITMLDANRAEVVCKWSDREADGTLRTDEIIWLVRQEPEGWRVAGMAATVFPDQPPYPLNFEDPEDMLRQQEKIKAEMARREAAAQATAQTPPAPTQPAQPQPTPPSPTQASQTQPTQTQAAQNPNPDQPLRR